MRALPTLALALLLAACGSETTDDPDSSAPGDDGGIADAGAPSDGGADMDAGDDAGPSSDDAGAAMDAGGDPDGGGADAGGAECAPDAVRFEALASGPLEEGILCDDLFVCARNSAEVGRVVSASTVFTCGGEPSSFCSGGTVCRYADPGGPGIVDADELAEICAITVLMPTPDIACVVYGP